MSSASSNGAIASYRAIGAHGDVESADPHRLIELMMDGALDRIAAAVGFMARGEVAAKGENVSRAIMLVEALRASLDSTRSEPIVANLDALYEYMARRLLESNLRNDRAGFDEVSGLLREIRDAWARIPPEARRRPHGSAG